MFLRAKPKYTFCHLSLFNRNESVALQVVKRMFTCIGCLDAKWYLRFGHMRTAEALINLCICAIWLGPSLSTQRIIGYYRMYEWWAKARMILCSGWAEASAWPRVHGSWLEIMSSSVRLPLEAELIPWLYGISLHTVFYYQPASVAQLNARPTGDQEFVGSTPRRVGNIFSWRYRLED